MLFFAFILSLLWTIKIQSIDYPGGWNPSSSFSPQCVNICRISNPFPTCNNHSSFYSHCQQKKQIPGDYDYLVLEQLYLSQYCRELVHGIDVTLSHHNILPYPHGLECQNQSWNYLSIHGLWPNYYGGFPTCCNISTFNNNVVITNKPFIPSSFNESYPSLVKQLSMEWIDPTQNNSYSSLCTLHNHEFQKHGLCFHDLNQSSSSFHSLVKEKNIETRFNEDAYIYFNTTLNLIHHPSIHRATQFINIIASSFHQPYGHEILHLYPKKIVLYCSSRPEEYNALLSIRTCWDKKLMPMDCPIEEEMIKRSYSQERKMTKLCDLNTTISLYSYQAPSLPLTFQQSIAFEE